MYNKVEVQECTNLISVSSLLVGSIFRYKGHLNLVTESASGPTGAGRCYVNLVTGYSYIWVDTDNKNPKVEVLKEGTIINVTVKYEI